ncbi:2-hydroxy-3-keto-5-methylthiopentenyl-1-phosphate phosphatase [Neobacillus thermocopriae]|uniref:2-hydroxy-3-keto-5-methylthiopentenyl-1-phosphate phosphatase n=1 Tax=Neobacillus thermocopriae TaxID=1215031 RepID=A0A6B3TVU1_9BACI|nr:2-hydroxy-3-keto-5-methylthiopentenyl-1-phosphate phosphatase [Neobacillus thermocopriae]MED3623186.1 2-hydroxy-3-keto-5-methylthiopentenyl-1-phosphate phosphatase [Neobacillus thermocopriae]MED3715081.1 2-hydroxy-3-keto-5-methylthiopentenyl-1-phosphate phosphatase [Neobacillus thermocopriae]NEX79767.1 2-hydroxy-3-keto-5-methylthiopentenyl-1-phosphate phosphatase [Neobacillus thermocopriae]
MIKPVIYCDFDGTITESDNIIAIMKKFAPPEWVEIKDQILSQQISICEGVGKLFSLLPSRMKQEITTFAIENAKIRPGFKEFVQFAREEHIPFYIVSGGIDFFVHPILKDYGPFSGVFCNEADFSEDRINILWPYTCDKYCDNNCGCCKPSIIRKLNQNEDIYKIVIGDSVTDLEAAKMADLVLARDLLQEKCLEWGINHYGFDTFFECIDEIKKRIEVGELSC